MRDPGENAVRRFRLETIRQRADFLRAGSGRRANGPGFTILHRVDEQPSSLRFGFTVTKKIGNAPERNRIRRRLKAAVLACAPSIAGAQGDFVLLARREALSIEFSALVAGISRAITLLQSGGGAVSRPRR